MKTHRPNLILSLFFALLLGIPSFITAQQTSNLPVEPSFYKSYEWRNIGPDRGGRSLGASGSPGRPNEYYFGATGGC